MKLVLLIRKNIPYKSHKRRLTTITTPNKELSEIDISKENLSRNGHTIIDVATNVNIKMKEKLSVLEKQILKSSFI